jgi:hypothetical protein
MRHRFVPTDVPGVYRCSCGVQRMFALRVVRSRPTLRAFALYRFRATSLAGAARGIMRALGWSPWSTAAPLHNPRRRAR